jgi:riboflavin synthase
MFTGIITDVGEVISRDGGRFTIHCSYAPETICVGASIACDGCCLTATLIRPASHGSLFTVDVSNESLSRSTLGDWQPGRHINLERSLKVGAEVGGHIVLGHVDGVARIIDIRTDGESRRFSFTLPAALAPLITAKGSVSLDGTSLTVNETEGDRFGVNLIPHTLTVTTWQSKKPGDRVNLEVDPLARYVARLMEFRS